MFRAAVLHRQRPHMGIRESGTLPVCKKVAELPFREVCVPPEVGAIIKFGTDIRAKAQSTFCKRIGEAYGTDTAH